MLHILSASINSFVEQNVLKRNMKIVKHKNSYSSELINNEIISIK